MLRFRLCAMLLLLSGLTGLSGCSSAMMHELQPHRLWRLNRGPAPGNGALYCIPPEEVTVTDATPSVQPKN